MHKKKKKKRKNKHHKKLDDEDFDLIENNTGVKVQRRRLKKLVDQNEDGTSTGKVVKKEE